MNLMEHVRAVRPDQVTFVPDSESQKTSDHGFNLIEQGEKLRPLIAEAKDLGCRVSLFMDPDPEQIVLAKDLGADRIELYTEAYAAACGTASVGPMLKRYALAGSRSSGSRTWRERRARSQSYEFAGIACSLRVHRRSFHRPRVGERSA